MRLCFAGAIATPAGSDAPVPLGVSGSAAAVPTGFFGVVCDCCGAVGLLRGRASVRFEGFCCLRFCSARTIRYLCRRTRTGALIARRSPLRCVCADGGVGYLGRSPPLRKSGENHAPYPQSSNASRRSHLAVISTSTNSLRSIQLGRGTCIAKLRTEHSRKTVRPRRRGMTGKMVTASETVSRSRRPGRHASSANHRRFRRKSRQLHVPVLLHSFFHAPQEDSIPACRFVALLHRPEPVEVSDPQLGFHLTQEWRNLPRFTVGNRFTIVDFPVFIFSPWRTLVYGCGQDLMKQCFI